MRSLNGFGRNEILHLLNFGALEVEGFLPWSSNYTFLVRVHDAGADTLAVYKPSRGERPLWDFTKGSLYRREQAAFIISDALGWELVPPTVTRDGPHGMGSLQYFIEHDPECHYFTIEGKLDYRRQLQQIVLLDIVINNADRKGGHVLLEQDQEGAVTGRLWAIDHGVCFHMSHKLRTVIWEFAGQSIPDGLLSDLQALKDKLNIPSSTLSNQLQPLLSQSEVTALKRRLDHLVDRGCFWEPGPGRHYPWPPV